MKKAIRVGHVSQFTGILEPLVFDTSITMKNCLPTLLKVGLLVLVIAPRFAMGEWTNRYAKPDWLQHSVYFEGYELPVFSGDPFDLAAAPDGTRLAFAAQGWLWSLDLESGVATRLTFRGGVDSSPKWSPNAKQLVFVRDKGESTVIVLLDLTTGAEEILSNNEDTIELDPVFTSDGRSVLYSSAEMGDLDLWRLDLATRKRERLTSREGVERNPRLAVDESDNLIYVSADTGLRKEIRRRSMVDGTETVLAAVGRRGRVLFDLHPNGQTIVYSRPEQTSLELMDTDVPDAPFVIADGLDVLHTPVWSADGDQIYFVAASEGHGFAIYRVPSVGGERTLVPVSNWDWRAPMAKVRILTALEGENGSLPTRLAVEDANGHPVAPSASQTFRDSQTGYHYFYSDGVVELDVPAGELSIKAAHGLTAVKSVDIHVQSDTSNDANIKLRNLWDADTNGWVSGDHHLHLNYGGVYDVTPEELVQRMASENLQVATPLLANFDNILKDVQWAGAVYDGPSAAVVKFGQEVRSHAHGHIALLGMDHLYRPWFWGPPYPNYGKAAYSNSQVLQFARQNGGIAAYVHPILAGEPFSDRSLTSIPLELISDAVLGDLDMLEILCLWSSGLGNSELWYKLLNIGVPLAPIAGTDAFMDVHRGMSVGAVRTYVTLDTTELTWKKYSDALRSGRSFITNGPILIFEVDGVGPGDVIPESNEVVEWKLEFSSINPVNAVEVLINGDVVWSDNNLSAWSTRRYQGQFTIPKGGWIAARAYGGAADWPGMVADSFAHVAPVWIGSIGSVEPSARGRAADDLLTAVNIAEASLEKMYGKNDISLLKRRYTAARRKLESLR